MLPIYDTACEEAKLFYGFVNIGQINISEKCEIITAIANPLVGGAAGFLTHTNSLALKNS